jgi:carbonic anhydrase/acetyltransferase-like protein (isoleucine patch superfamily)
VEKPLSIDGKAPVLAEGVFIAPNAVLIGDITIDEGSSVWFGCVLRGDVGAIRIGKRTNVQDLACLHMTMGVSDVTIGDDVTIGHGAIVHGATIESGCLVGMGSILLDGVVVGEGSVIAAGALVTPRMIIPPGSMVKGSPAKIVRAATDEERAMGKAGAAHYVLGAAKYRALLER